METYMLRFVTSPAGAVAKYRDEHVYLSAKISPEPHARSLPMFLCTLPMAVAQSSSGRVTKSQREGEGVVFREGFFPIVTRLLQRGSVNRH